MARILSPTSNMGRDTTTNAMTRTASRKKDSHRALPDLRQMQAVSRRCGAARHGHLLSRFEQATSDDGPHRQWRAPLASKVRNAASRYSVHASVLTDSHSPRLSKPPRARSPLLVRSFARSLVRSFASWPKIGGASSPGAASNAHPTARTRSGGAPPSKRGV